jgi:hypothetical protein
VALESYIFGANARLLWNKGQLYRKREIRGITALTLESENQQEKERAGPKKAPPFV